MMRKNSIQSWDRYDMRAMENLLKPEDHNSSYVWKVLLFLLLTSGGFVSIVSLIIIISERFLLTIP